MLTTASRLQWPRLWPCGFVTGGLPGPLAPELALTRLAIPIHCFICNGHPRLHALKELRVGSPAFGKDLPIGQGAEDLPIERPGLIGKSRQGSEAPTPPHRAFCSESRSEIPWPAGNGPVLGWTGPCMVYSEQASLRLWRSGGGIRIILNRRRAGLPIL